MLRIQDIDGSPERVVGFEGEWFNWVSPESFVFTATTEPKGKTRICLAHIDGSPPARHIASTAPLRQDSGVGAYPEYVLAPDRNSVAVTWAFYR